MINGDYILIKPPVEYPGKRYRGKYVYEHHVIWWMNTGEILKDKEIIHHINHDKHDNSIESMINKQIKSKLK